MADAFKTIQFAMELRFLLLSIGQRNDRSATKSKSLGNHEINVASDKNYVSISKLKTKRIWKNQLNEPFCLVVVHIGEA